jgi:hypothetical protein
MHHARIAHRAQDVAASAARRTAEANSGEIEGGARATCRLMIPSQNCAQF